MSPNRCTYSCRGQVNNYTCTNWSARLWPVILPVAFIVFPAFIVLMYKHFKAAVLVKHTFHMFVLRKIMNKNNEKPRGCKFLSQNIREVIIMCHVENCTCTLVYIININIYKPNYKTSFIQNKKKGFILFVDLKSWGDKKSPLFLLDKMKICFHCGSTQLIGITVVFSALVVFTLPEIITAVVRELRRNSSTVVFK